MIKSIPKQPTTSSNSPLKWDDKRMVVVIVGTDEIYQHLTEFSFKQHIQWIQSDTELQADRILQFYRPDCVLVDGVFAYNNGFYIFDICAHYQVPVIALTEEDDHNTIAKLKRYGVVVCMTKRYLTAAALESAIGIAIEKHEAWSPMPPMPLSESSSLAQHPHGQMRAPDLLIVDDDDYFVGALKRHLRPQGYEMRSAGTVNQAIESTETSRPDLILLDIKLPVVDGWWLAAWLKASRETAEIPVIVLTGLAEPEVQAKAQSYGTFACLAKPVVTDVLLETVQDALSWHERS